MTDRLPLVSRRSFLSASSLLLAPATARADVIRNDFPSHAPELVEEMVAVSHNNFARVKELVGRQPALAKVAFDWGFGDWEACIDAASHIGRKEIAEFLIASGARPTIFSAAMLGQLDVVKAFVAARPGVQRTYGPHGITLMSHARAGGADAAPVVQYLTALGDADLPLPSVSLLNQDRDALVGRYVFGAGPRDYFTIDVQNDRLGIERAGGPSRRFLFHTGNFVFFPTGVPSARIAFRYDGGGGKVTQLTLADPTVLVTAKRE